MKTALERKDSSILQLLDQMAAEQFAELMTRLNDKTKTRILHLFLDQTAYQKADTKPKGLVVYLSVWRTNAKAKITLDSLFSDATTVIALMNELENSNILLQRENLYAPIDAFVAQDQSCDKIRLQQLQNHVADMADSVSSAESNSNEEILEKDNKEFVEKEDAVVGNSSKTMLLLVRRCCCFLVALWKFSLIRGINF